MKLATTLITLGLTLAGGVVSDPIPVNLDLAAFQAIFNSIDSSSSAYSAAIKRGQEGGIISAGDNLVTDINKGVENANVKEKFSAFEVLGLIMPLESLTKKIEAMTGEIIAKKDEFKA
ncbi:hypothetical protein PAAG_09119, partial [Paracoccidioides lutzii Pb01]